MRNKILIKKLHPYVFVTRNNLLLRKCKMIILKCIFEAETSENFVILSLKKSIQIIFDTFAHF